jgi:hypothetical protein
LPHPICRVERARRRPEQHDRGRYRRFAKSAAEFRFHVENADVTYPGAKQWACSQNCFTLAIIAFRKTVGGWLITELRWMKALFGSAVMIFVPSVVLFSCCLSVQGLFSFGN